jgi:hypothetical protein
VSRTVTRNEHEAVLPASSVAVAVTIVSPSGNCDPLAALYAIDGDAVTASVATGAGKLTAAPVVPVASAVTSAGRDRGWRRVPHGHRNEHEAVFPPRRSRWP